MWYFAWVLGIGFAVLLAILNAMWGESEAARAEASRIGITLVDNADLLARAEKVRRSEPCPTCAKPMRLGRSTHGWWFRCVATGCQGKRDLGGDVSAAVEWLTRDPAAP